MAADAATRRPQPAVVVASWIFVAASLLLIMQIFTDAIKHFDQGWPIHASFHLVVAVVRQAGISLITILIARRAFLAGERWSWYALLIFCLFGWGATFLATAYVGLENGPGAKSWVEIGLVLSALAVGLIISWRPIFRPEKA